MPMDIGMYTDSENARTQSFPQSGKEENHDC